MSQRRVYVLIGVLWCASLVAVGLAADRGEAQAQLFRPLPTPKVMSAPDVGFEVTGMYGDVPAGHVVVRVKGEWVRVRLGAPQRTPSF
jgi:hypothetical protein